MVVCKFFQQGNCRYGQNCRFEHIYGSKYSYHASAPAQASQAAPAAPAGVTDEQLVNQVHLDVQAVLQGNQWILSSYAPFKKALLPGLTDLSPEEARLFIYEAKASNNLDQAVTYMNNLFKEARAKHEQLLLKNANLTTLLRNLYNSENVASPFGNTSQGITSNPASSIFRSAVTSIPTQNNQASIFGQSNQQSAFAQNATPSIFGQSNPDPAKSIFAQANQGSFTNQTVFGPSSNAGQTNVFGPTTDTAAKSIFSQAAQNVFAQQSAQNNAASVFANASQSVFGQNQSSSFGQNQPSAFGQNQPSAFGQNQPSSFGQNQPSSQNFNVFQQSSDDDLYIYSKMEELSAEDLAAFNSEDFKMGFIPELPPPRSLCI